MKIHNNYIIYLLFLMIFAGCDKLSKKEGQCFQFQDKSKFKNSKLLLYIDSEMDNECVYDLNSFYLDKLQEKQFIFDGSNAFIKLTSSKEFDLMFSFDDEIRKKRKIKIKHRNWFNNKGNEYIVKSYSVELLEKKEHKNEKFIVLKINKLITAFKEIGIMDGVLVFSDKKGFIGSYYQNPDEPMKIVQKSGDILENLIDYSLKEFMKIN